MANGTTELDIDNRLNDYNTQESLDYTKFISKAVVPDIIKEKELDSSSCSVNSTIADILNLNTIRGGTKMIKGGGCGCSGMSGGCFTCKKGVKKMLFFFQF